MSGFDIEESLRSASTVAQAAVQSGIEIGRRERGVEVQVLRGQIRTLEELIEVLCAASETALPNTVEAARARVVQLKLERQIHE